MTRLGRTWLYLREMAPPHVFIPVGFLKFFVVYLCLQALASPAPLVSTWRSLLGGLSVALAMILMRIFDELKDVEIDIRLGRAGDPRYKDRAIVRGAVTVDDIRNLRNLVIAALFAVNISMMTLIPILGFSFLFVVMWLSSVWFFWPAMSRSLALAFITHNPISLVIGLYIVSVFVGDFGHGSLDGPYTVLLLIATWLPVAAWETSRKIRIPSEETDYETYSKLLGWKTAAIVPAVFVTGAAVAIGFVAQRAEVPGWYFAALAIAASIPILGCLRFRFAPTSGRAKLQPLTEAFAGISDVALVAALIASRGVTLP